MLLKNLFMHSKTFGPPPNFIFCFNFATNYMKDLWFIYIISFKLCVFICKYAECRNDLVSNWLIPVIKKKYLARCIQLQFSLGYEQLSFADIQIVPLERKVCGICLLDYFHTEAISEKVKC